MDFNKETSIVKTSTLIIPELMPSSPLGHFSGLSDSHSGNGVTGKRIRQGSQHLSPVPSFSSGKRKKGKNGCFFLVYICFKKAVRCGQTEWVMPIQIPYMSSSAAFFLWTHPGSTQHASFLSETEHGRRKPSGKVGDWAISRGTWVLTRLSSVFPIIWALCDVVDIYDSVRVFAQQVLKYVSQNKQLPSFPCNSLL